MVTRFVWRKYWCILISGAERKTNVYERKFLEVKQILWGIRWQKSFTSFGRSSSSSAGMYIRNTNVDFCYENTPTPTLRTTCAPEERSYLTPERAQYCSEYGVCHVVEMKTSKAPAVFIKCFGGRFLFLAIDVLFFFKLPCIFIYFHFLKCFRFIILFCFKKSWT